MRRLGASSTFLLLLLAPACAAHRHAGAEVDRLVPAEDEARMGEETRARMVEQGVRFLETPDIRGYAEQVVGRLAPAAGRERPGLRWQVSVIDAPKLVNAFATPGGHVYVCTGLLLQAQSEAEVAGVLAHEMGHVVARHTARQRIETDELHATSLKAFGVAGLLPKLVVEATGQILLLAYSRADELEADELAARYMADAGYDPRALVTFLERLREGQQAGLEVPSWFSTHPSTTERIQRLSTAVAQAPAGGNEGHERLAAIQVLLGEQP